MTLTGYELCTSHILLTSHSHTLFSAKRMRGKHIKKVISLTEHEYLISFFLKPSEKVTTLHKISVISFFLSSHSPFQILITGSYLADVSINTSLHRLGEMLHN